MKRFLIITATLATALFGVAALDASAVSEESVPMTEAHIARIRSNCVEAQSVLFQLHASDAGLRVNRGQLYESISTKLMIPLNSRMILNRIDTTNLLSIATQYEQQLAAFRTQYQTYEEKMSSTLAMDCINQPVAFYDSVTDTRKQRQLTHSKTLELHKSIDKYGKEFESFARSFGADQS